MTKRIAFLATLVALAAAGNSCGPGLDLRSVEATNAQSLEIMTSSLPSATLGSSYKARLRAWSGTPPYTWQIVLGKLPSGLKLDASSALLFGTPTSKGTFQFTVGVKDSRLGRPQTANLSLTLTVAPSPVVITTTTIPGGTQGQPFVVQLEATGGTQPYFWSVIDGSLPTGLTLDPLTGTLQGTPTNPGTFSFTILVADSSSPQITAVLVIKSPTPKISG